MSNFHSTFIELGYVEAKDKYQKFRSLLEQEWAILLDSGVSSGAGSAKTKSSKADEYRRYDILVARPCIELTVEEMAFKRESDGDSDAESNIESHPGNSVSTTKSGCHYILNSSLKDKNTKSMLSKIVDKGPTDKPFSLMQEIAHLVKQTNAANEANLPFNGGWLGYISYDIGRVLEKLPHQATNDLHTPLIQMGYYQWAIITDHLNATTRLWNFGLDKDKWQTIVAEIQQLLSANHQNSSTQATTSLAAEYRCSPWRKDTEEACYRQSFQKVKDYIKAGDCYQVNLAQRFHADFNGSALSAYQQLATINDAPFSAWLNLPGQQILSLSPERFIEVQNGRVKTQPIKGTRPRSPEPATDLQLADSLVNSEKDRAENLMIVDLLRNDLSHTAATGSVVTSELFGVYSFESVHHLISTVESKLDAEKTCYDLLATCLPGGSITGAPKIRAMEIIDELEPFRRHVYCGIVGYISNNGNMDSNICIRTLAISKGKIYCWAGGGLVFDSNCEAEYQETFDKITKILPVLNSEYGS